MARALRRPKLGARRWEPALPRTYADRRGRRHRGTRPTARRREVRDSAVPHAVVVVVKPAGLAAVLAPRTGRSVRPTRRAESSKAAPKIPAVGAVSGLAAAAAQTARTSASRLTEGSSSQQTA